MNMFGTKRVQIGNSGTVVLPSSINQILTDFEGKKFHRLAPPLCPIFFCKKKKIKKKIKK